MDKTKNREVKQKRENYSDWHSITYKMSVRRLLVLQSWPFIKNYKAECEVHPTSWKLKVAFIEVREDSTASLSINLKRTDGEDTQPIGIFTVRICHPHDHLLFPEQKFYRERMLPGDVIQENVEIALFPEEYIDITKNIVVHICLKIGFCHAGLDFSSTNSESSEANFSMEY